MSRTLKRDYDGSTRNCPEIDRQKKVIGDVTHSVHPRIHQEISTVGLTIQSVTLNKTAVKFETTDAKLIILLAPARRRATSSTWRSYEGKTTKGVYFIFAR
jgi:hypothetical protein